MVDYATLVFDIESGPARTAATDLAKLNQAAVKASSGADKLNKTLRDANGRFVSSSDVVKKYGSEVRTLADRFNPALSAAYKYQQLQVDLNRAVSLGVITQKNAEAQLSKFSSAMGRGVGGASHHVANLSFQINDIGMMLASGQNPFMLMIQQGPQVAQIFSQIQAEGKGIGSVIGGAFRMILNPMTAITLATIGLGAAFTQWGLGITSTTSKAKSLTETIEDLSSKVSALKAANAVFTLSGLEQLRQKYGEVDSQVINLINNQKTYADLLAADSLKASLEALNAAAGSRWSDIGLSDWVSGVLRLQTELKTTRKNAETLKTAFDLLNSATNYEDQITQLQILARYMGMLADTTDKEARVAALELLGTINDATDAVIQLSRSAPSREWMAPAIAGAQELITLLDAAGLATNIPEGHGARKPPQRPGVDSYGNFLDARKPKGGGGGGAALKQAQKQFQNLRELLEQETLFEVAEFQKRQEQLDLAYAKRLLSEQKYQEMKAQLQTFYFGTDAQKDLLNYQMSLEQLDLFHQQGLIKEEQYQIQRRQLQDKYYSGAIATDQSNLSSQLSSMANHFGQLNQLAGGGYDKLARAQKTFAAGSALINAYLAATQALADPTVPYWGKFAAFASVLAAGMGAVNAIKGGSGGGKGSTSTSAATATKAQPTQYVTIDVTGDSWAVGLVEGVIEQIQQQTKDGRVVFMGNGR